MKKLYINAVLCCIFLNVFSQENQWGWLSGDNSIEQAGVYGTKGIAAPNNKPGGRNAAVKWTDASGNFWLFGGAGHDVNGFFGYLNDLWKFDPNTGLWTWVSGDNSIGQTGVYGTKGAASAANKPGSRYSSISWSDNAGRLWLMGGLGFDETMMGLLNDLWMFDPVASTWTWIGGEKTIDHNGVYGSLGSASGTNQPGSRQQSVSWKDAAGNFWLFGGFGRDRSGRFDGALNDLWKYFPATNQWAWVSGDSTIEMSGIYGTKGVPSPLNKPGSRSSSVGWTDATGNLWLFGGLGYPAGTGAGYLNDLWRYSPASNQWTWMSGDNVIDQPGIYGVKGTAAIANKPGARYSSVTWNDALGNLLLFGGVVPPLGSGDVANDLWSFNPGSNLWTWLGGDNTINQPGMYGTKGTFSSTNKPGGRHSSATWTDATGNPFLFGGQGYASNTRGNLNDLWKFSVNVNTLPVTITSFEAIRQNNVANLNWSTSAEYNSKYYGVERSANGINFDSIGMNIAAGYANTITSYEFTDKLPLIGSNFYRLKQVDADNRVTYSVIRKVNFSSTRFGYTILQNPVYNSLRLSLHPGSTGKTEFRVTDASGRLLIREEQLLPGSGIVHSIPIQNLSKGTYYITVRSGSEVITKGFVIR